MVRLIVDRKVMTWIRTTVDVDATTVQEAVDKYNNPMLPGCNFLNSEELSGTRMPISVKENKGTPTLEVFVPDWHHKVWNNLNGYNEIIESNTQSENAADNAQAYRGTRGITRSEDQEPSKGKAKETAKAGAA